MKKIFCAGISIALAMGLSSAAQAQDGAESTSNKAAVVVELEPPTFNDAKSGRVSDEPIYYQKGNRRGAAQRGSDATKFCNRINYSFGLALEYGTIQAGAFGPEAPRSETVEYDYLKRVICFE